MKLTRKIGFFLLSILLINNTVARAQNNRCGTMNVLSRHLQQDPSLQHQREVLEDAIQRYIQDNASKTQVPAIITIPVVVHVVWNATLENISDPQIHSQIDRLNKDYRKLNTDMVPSSHPFYALAGDAGIEFCLATIDPNGNPTSGITRTHTNSIDFTEDDKVKSSSTGGIEGWDPENYLNLWVCNLAGDLLGYAQFPTDLGTFPETDGVVIKYSNFGTVGTLTTNYDLGRTATHEIGHWFNLQHIWGDDSNLDDNCDVGECASSDNVADTPNQCDATTNCPSHSFAFVTDDCTPGNPGIMYEDYMDYTYDACMVMFTNGQVTRMRAALTLARTAILSSSKCGPATLVNQQLNHPLKIYPNPVENYLTIEGLPQTRSKTFTVDIYNVIGEKVYSTVLKAADHLIEMIGFKTGTYFMTINNEEFSVTQKLTVVK
ncbi:MAG: zinc metalloprotease [Bacteroidota bacterium]|nr:zinc metalloprotease [Bacteroidota bacterium]